MTKNANGKYSVTSIFYDGGRMIVRETETGDIVGEGERCDTYIDEFDTLLEALDFIEEAKYA